MKKNLVEEFKEFCRDKYKYNLKNLDEIIEMYQEFEKSRAPTEVKSDIKELLFSEIMKSREHICAVPSAAIVTLFATTI